MTRTARTPPRLGRVEFTSLLAMSMALAALGVDMMLPAFPAMRAGLGLGPESTAVAGIITAYLIGLALGQVVYGPLADHLGRKPTLYLSYGVYIAGALASTLAPGLGAILAARFVWGVGAAGPRVITVAVIRDRFDGEEMARAMSFIMAVFILVPVVAPTLGAFITSVTTWRWLFAVCGLLAGAMWIWATRLQETLHPEHRRELSFNQVWLAARRVVSDRQAFGYTLALTALFGVLYSYLASSEIIFGEVFGVVEGFPLMFGGLAAVMGAAMLANAFAVRRVGTRRLVHFVLITYVAAAVIFAAASLVAGGRPSLAVFLTGLAIMLACQALLIPNFNTVAMQPMAAIAGTASAVIGTLSTAGGALIGAVIDRTFDGTVIPLSVAFALLGATSLACVTWAERGRLFRPLDS